ncbi:unnamed protein product, partial [Meganyctiphanes norvegica]
CPKGSTCKGGMKGKCKKKCKGKWKDSGAGCEKYGYDNTCKCCIKKPKEACKGKCNKVNGKKVKGKCMEKDTCLKLKDGKDWGAGCKKLVTITVYAVKNVSNTTNVRI